EAGRPVTNLDGYVGVNDQMAAGTLNAAQLAGRVKPWAPKEGNPGDPAIGALAQAAADPGRTGLAGFAREDLNRIFGATGLSFLLPGGQIAPGSEASSQMVDMANTILKRGLLGSRAAEAGVREQAGVKGLLIDNGILTNPAVAAQKVATAYQALRERDASIVDQLDRLGVNGDPKSRAELIQLKSETEAALNMLTDPQWMKRFPVGTGGQNTPAPAANDYVATPKTAAPAASSGPAVGTVEDGYRFNGGDPKDPASWTPVK
ncbi:MAG: hypothetical protein K2X91_08560, partial [Thermoleophilia bacterium]|nr:hypothetical protein [Thermoleophilia bacterium]